MTTISRIAVDGADIDLLDVFHQVVIRHGRGSLDDGPTPSSATLQLVNVDRAYAAAFRVTTDLVIDIDEPSPLTWADVPTDATWATSDGLLEATFDSSPRFRGKITDATLKAGALSLIAVGPLGYIGPEPCGLVDYPAETWSDRVARVFNEMGESARLLLRVGTFNPVLAARVAAVEGETTLSEMLAELSASVPAAIADTMDGRILVQALSYRNSLAHTTLDPDLVVADPPFTQIDTVRNVVNVEWEGGVPQTATDPGSDVRSKTRTTTITTKLTTDTAAIMRAATELVFHSIPAWSLDKVEYLELDPHFDVGSPLLVDSLDVDAPADQWLAILEGWEDHIASEADVVGGEKTRVIKGRMTLSLSAAQLSGVGSKWSDVPAGDKWNTVPPTDTWADNLELTL